MHCGVLSRHDKACVLERKIGAVAVETKHLSWAQVPSADLLPRFNSTATAGSRATANILDPFVVRPATADKGSQVT